MQTYFRSQASDFAGYKIKLPHHEDLPSVVGVVRRIDIGYGPRVDVDPHRADVQSRVRLPPRAARDGATLDAQVADVVQFLVEILVDLVRVGIEGVV